MDESKRMGFYTLTLVAEAALLKRPVSSQELPRIAGARRFTS